MLIALVEYGTMKIFYFIENGVWYYAYYEEGELIEICETDSKGLEKTINHAIEFAGIENVKYYFRDTEYNLIRII